jgi:hypothetical protein
MRFSSRLRSLASALVHAALTLSGCAFTAFMLSGCTPTIGDKCVLSTDCSTRGDRLCDTSQPDGYCTQFNCSKNSCPDNAACILFNAAIQGCGYDDRSGGYGSRVARAFCVASCGKDSDCRAGYVCADPRSAPWNGFVQDDVQDKRTCLVIPPGYPDGGADAAITSHEPPPVCSAVGPKVPPIDASPPHIADDASVTPVDAGVSDAGDAGDAADGD